MFAFVELYVRKQRHFSPKFNSLLGLMYRLTKWTPKEFKSQKSIQIGHLQFSLLPRPKLDAFFFNFRWPTRPTFWVVAFPCLQSSLASPLAGDGVFPSGKCCVSVAQFVPATGNFLLWRTAATCDLLLRPISAESLPSSESSSSSPSRLLKLWLQLVFP